MAAASVLAIEHLWAIPLLECSPRRWRRVADCLITMEDLVASDGHRTRGRASSRGRGAARYVGLIRNARMNIGLRRLVNLARSGAEIRLRLTNSRFSRR